jgi:hypothetical protein
VAGGGIMSTLGTIAKYVSIAGIVSLIVIWLTTLRLTMLEQPFLGGIFNIAFLGVPAYLFIGLALIVLIIIFEVGMYWFYWRPFEYMHGLYRAYWDKINAVFVGDLKNRYQLIAENKAKLVHLHEDYEKLYDAFFSKKDAMTRLSVWVGRRFGRNYDMMIARDLEPGMPDKSIVHAGGIDIDLIFDFDQWLYTDTPQRREMIRMTDAWNPLNPNDEIYTVRKFQQYFLEGKFEDAGIFTSVLKPTVTIPWPRIKAAMPVQGATAPGYERQRAKEIEEQDEGDLKGYTLPIIGLTILIFLALMGLRAIGIVGHLHAAG